MAEYTIMSVRPSVFLDKAGNPVNGYDVEFFIPAFDEIHHVKVGKRDPKAVEAEIAKELAFRKSLAELG